jgi:dephospho-CoA kinase
MTSVKCIIGLTGNIATGKSVVRQMLVNHGALGIDADVIAHRVLYPGGSAYRPVVDAFGPQILTPSGEIAREKLAEIVFSSPKHLRQLEALTHSTVSEAIQNRIDTSTLPMVVIEAIKLMESDLVNLISSLWVSHVSEEKQLARLIEIRGMAAEDARQRILAQPPQSEKLSRADVVIHTDGTFENTWRQIQTALNDTIHLVTTLEAPYINIVNNGWIHPVGSLPASQIAAFFAEHLAESQVDLYRWLAFKVLTPVIKEQELEQCLVWENRNFTGKLERLIPMPATLKQAETALIALEVHARANQCELLVIPDNIAEELGNVLPQNGFKPVQKDNLTYPDWKQAVSSTQAHWIKIIDQPRESTHKTFFD